MKTFPVYFYGKEVCQWNPLIQNLMDALQPSLMEKRLSTSDYGNLLVDLYTDKVVVTTKMSGTGG